MMRRIMLIGVAVFCAMLVGCASGNAPALPAPLAQFMVPCPAVSVDTVLWSHDSTQLAYYFDRHPYILSVPTNQKSSARGFNTESRPFAWSPDGSRLLLAGIDGAQLIDADGRNLTDLPSGMHLQSYGGSWSPDGTRIAFGWFNPNLQRFQLALWDERTNAITTVYTEEEQGMLLLHPTWSPDAAEQSSERIAVIASSGPRGNGHIRVVTIDDPDADVLTIDQKSFLPPMWSPDGKYIATMDWGQDDGIYILSADGATQTRLTDEPAATMRWLPDSSGLLAVNIDISTGLETVIRVGIDGEISELAPFVLDGSLSISPDGSEHGSERIAFISDEQGFDDLYLMNVDGSEKVRLTVNSGYSTCIDWPF